MSDTKAHKMAARMLGISPSHAQLMHCELYDLITEVDRLAGSIDDGSLRSRQAIAILVAQWKRNNPDKDAVPHE